jgi:hypothetical protein
LLAARQALNEYEAFVAQFQASIREAVDGSVECLLESKDLLKRIAQAAGISGAFYS